VRNSGGGKTHKFLLSLDIIVKDLGRNINHLQSVPLIFIIIANNFAFFNLEKLKRRN